MSFGATSRMSIISDHNIYKPTDNLYSPLRSALSRSKISGFNTGASTTIENPNQKSLLKGTTRKISPIQATFIQRTTLIPIDKQLVPTNHIEKVAGKKFVTLDSTQKRGSPIPAIYFNRPINKVQQIVYEIKGQNTNKVQNIYTPPTYYHNQINRTYYPQVVSSLSPKIINTQRNLTTNSSQKHLTNNPFQLPVNISNNLKTVRSSDNLSLKRQDNYNFKRLRSAQQKKQYKYNLYNFLDQGINSGCKQGCSGNEIIASKMQQNRWQ